MYKKMIKYTDYNGVEREEPHYFHLNKGEIILKVLSKNGGYQNYLNRLVSSNDQEEMLKVFNNYIDISYGVKSDDGLRFIKNDELLTNFKQSEAYSELIFELLTNEKSAQEFFDGILPAALIAQATAQIERANKENGHI